MPPSPAPDSKYPPVPNNIKKALLQIIKRTGTPDISDRNSNLFGDPGSDRGGLQFYNNPEAGKYFWIKQKFLMAKPQIDYFG
jgi:hypothetical protein